MAKNTLIVDDSATIRKLVMRGIRHADTDHSELGEADVWQADERPTALNAGSFDLVLTDVDMPAAAPPERTQDLIGPRVQ